MSYFNLNTQTQILFKINPQNSQWNHTICKQSRSYARCRFCLHWALLQIKRFFFHIWLRRGWTIFLPLLTSPLSLCKLSGEMTDIELESALLSHKSAFSDTKTISTVFMCCYLSLVASQNSKLEKLEIFIKWNFLITRKKHF